MDSHVVVAMDWERVKLMKPDWAAAMISEAGTLRDKDVDVVMK